MNMKMNTIFLIGALLLCGVTSGFAQVVSVSGDASALPVTASANWSSCDCNNNSSSTATLTATFDLIMTNVSVSLNSITRSASDNNINGWGTMMSDEDMGFQLHSPNGVVVDLIPTTWLAPGDVATGFTNIEIVNSSATASLVKPGSPIYIGSTNGLPLSCYNGYTLQSETAWPSAWTNGTTNARGTWQLEVDAADAASESTWSSPCITGTVWTYWGNPTNVTVNKWGLNFTGKYAVAFLPNDNMFTSTLQKIGTTAEQCVTVANNGNYQLVITGVNNWSGQSQDYSIDPSTVFPITIAPGGSGQICVDFTPTFFGLRQAQFNIVSNGLNTSTNPVTAASPTVFLFGTGEAPLMSSSNAGSLFLQERELVRQDTVRYLHITNAGNQALVIGQWNSTQTSLIPGTNGAVVTNFIDPNGNLTTGAHDYTIIYPLALTGNNGSYTILPGKTDSIGVKFTPSAEGPRVALLNVYSNAANINTQSLKSTDSIGVLLEGIGTAPHLSVTWSNFGTIDEGTIDTTTVCVTDTGSGEAIFSSQKFISGDVGQFKILSPLPKTIQPDSSACMTVTFTPDTTSGYEFVRLQLVTNAVTSDSNEIIELQGISVPTADAKFSPASLFGTSTVQTCGPPISGNVVVTDAGSTALEISGISFTGASSMNYQVSLPPGTHFPITVQPGSTDTLHILFSPAKGHGGASTGQAVILSNNIGGGVNTITLYGTAPEEDAVSTRDSLFVGTVIDIAATKTQTDTLRNPGNATVTITSQTLTGNDAAAYSIVTPFTPGTITAGGISVATIAFKPNGVSYATQPTVAELRVGTTSECDSSVTIPLLGRSCESGVLATPDTSSVLFGNISIPENTQKTQTIFLQNIGCDSLTITSATMSGPDVSQYANGVVVFPKTAIPSAGVDSVIVTFSPTTLGQKVATLTITTSAGNTYTYSLEGTATAGVSGVGESVVSLYTTGLLQNYPNPYASATTITYELGVRGTATLEVLNVLGERVATLASGTLAAGRYSAVFDASGLPEGVYFYRLQTETSTEMRMMNVLR